MPGERRRQPRVPKGIPLVTTTEAAYLLGVSVRTFWRLVEQRKILPAGIIGTANVYYRDEVVALRRKLYGS